MAPHVHTIRGDSGMFATGLHVSTVPVGVKGIMQPHALDGHLSTSTSSHEISLEPSMPYLLKASCGHMQKGYRASFHCGDPGHHVMACLHSSPVETRPPYFANTIV